MLMLQNARPDSFHFGPWSRTRASTAVNLLLLSRLLSPHWRLYCGAITRAFSATSAAPEARAPISRTRYESAQRRDHRPCRPWQDHPGRPAAAAVGHLPGQSAPGRAGDGFQRSRARARHHHSGQGDLDHVGRHPHQHRRYAGPRRFRRRGRAHPQHGRRRAGAGRRRRRSAAADQIRGLQGAEDGPEAHRRDQQGGPPRCAARSKW